MAKQFDAAGSVDERSYSLLPGTRPKGQSPADDDQLAADPLAAGEGLGACELFEEWDQKPSGPKSPGALEDPAVEMLEMGLLQAD